MSDTVIHPFSISFPELGVFDVDGRAEVVVTSFGDPGRTYGPPEHCYPPEPGEAHVEDIEVITGRNEAGDVFSHLPTNEAGIEWGRKLRAALEADDDWMADAIEEANEWRLSAREEAAEMRAEERRMERDWR